MRRDAALLFVCWGFPTRRDDGLWGALEMRDGGSKGVRVGRTVGLRLLVWVLLATWRAVLDAALL